MSEELEDLLGDHLRLCYCGCAQEDHNGRCAYCSDCEQFYYDEEGTLEAAVQMNDTIDDIFGRETRETTEGVPPIPAKEELLASFPSRPIRTD